MREETGNWSSLGNTRKQAYNFGTGTWRIKHLHWLFDTNYKISKPDIRCREFSLHRNVHLIKKESPITLGVIILKLLFELMNISTYHQQKRDN